MEKIDEKFDERLYMLNVEDVPREEIPRIIDPNDSASNDNGVVVCYNPTKNQQIQLALTIWQVATKERNALKVRTRQFEIAEDRCTKTRNVLKSLLLPFVDGNVEKAKDLCITLLRENKQILEKYIKDWEIIPRPSSIWVDKHSNGIFLAEYKNRMVVGLNPRDYVFVYKGKSK